MISPWVVEWLLFWYILDLRTTATDGDFFLVNIGKWMYFRFSVHLLFTVSKHFKKYFVTIRVFYSKGCFEGQIVLYTVQKHVFCIDIDLKDQEHCKVTRTRLQ